MAMELNELFFTSLSVFLVATVFISEWFNSKGNLRIVYPLESIKFFGFLILETGLALNHPDQWAIMLFNIANLWGLAMNIKGYRRLLATQSANV